VRSERRDRSSEGVGTGAMVSCWRVTRSMLRSRPRSRGSAIVMATPCRPARPGAPDAVHVGVRRARHVVVDDVRHVLDVEPARRHVGGDEQLDLAAAEAAHHAVARLLPHPAVQRLGAEAARGERLGELVRLVARAAEHDGARRRLHVEHAAEGRDLVGARHDVGGAAHARHLALGELAARHLDAGRVAQVAVGDARDARRHRGREEGRLALGGVAPTIAVRSSSKPMSSISSASSSTSTRTASSLSVPRFTWSRARPGVATTTSTPRSRARSCCPIAAPPYTASTRVPKPRPYLWMASATCMHSSRVGTSTSARGAPLPAPRGGAPSTIRWSNGSANAAVFPVPVAAMPSASRPESSTGIASRWMGVGSS
jgi:hypothetical protein